MLKNPEKAAFTKFSIPYCPECLYINSGPFKMLFSYPIMFIWSLDLQLDGSCRSWRFPRQLQSLHSQIIVVVAMQVLCVRSMRCKASGVDDGDPSAPRTEKTTAHDCVLLSTRNQVYHDPQSSQVLCVSACVYVFRPKKQNKRNSQKIHV